jgi:hypothetical protein
VLKELHRSKKTAYTYTAQKSNLEIRINVNFATKVVQSSKYSGKKYKMISDHSEDQCAAKPRSTDLFPDLLLQALDGIEVKLVQLQKKGVDQTQSASLFAVRVAESLEGRKKDLDAYLPVLEERLLAHKVLHLCSLKKKKKVSEWITKM